VKRHQRRKSRRPIAGRVAELILPEATLVDVVDTLLAKGVLLDGDLLLGVADIDLIRLRLSAILGDADRFGKKSSRAEAAPRLPAPPEKNGRAPSVPDGKFRVAPAPPAAIKARRAGKKASKRWNASPEETRRSVAKLVLSLVEFLRELMERQAVRRVERGTLSSQEIERVGLALQELEKTVAQMAETFGLDPSELNLDLGPLGNLR
jgi:hypothetical protein